MLIPVVALLALGTAAAQQPGPGTSVPGGTYKLTTKNQKVMLTCTCEKTGGAKVSSSLDITKLVNPDIVNAEGVLKVGTANKVPTTTFTPGGSYSKTCSDIKVMLMADTQKADKSWTTSSLDITKLPMTTALTNVNGVLQVTK